MSSFEHRKHPRRRHRQTAWIETSNGPVECSIVDISENGARIRHPLTDIEIQFTLRLSEDGKVARECCVVWQDGGMIGVLFLGKRISPMPGGPLK
jgi:hypothetical protein